jgi:hypothetical protein
MMKESYITSYLNRDDVRSALHIDHNRKWTACDDFLWTNYSQESMSTHIEPHYKTLIDYDYEALNMEPLKIMVFSGDDDAVMHMYICVTLSLLFTIVFCCCWW